MITYTPHIAHNIPFLQIPENRVALAYNWYRRDIEHPMNFPAYGYWIQQCEQDGSDY